MTLNNELRVDVSCYTHGCHPSIKLPHQVGYKLMNGHIFFMPCLKLKSQVDNAVYLFYYFCPFDDWVKMNVQLSC